MGWKFEQMCVVPSAARGDEEPLLVVFMEGGAETYELIDLDEETPGAEVFCAPVDLETLDTALKTYGYAVQQSELRWIPSNTVAVTDPDQARLLMKLSPSPPIVTWMKRRVLL